jgi:hypothetical protein
MRSVASDGAAANEMPVKEFRHLFDVALALVAGTREREVSDEALIQWISVQVGKHGLTTTAEMLN